MGGKFSFNMKQDESKDYTTEANSSINTRSNVNNTVLGEIKNFYRTFARKNTQEQFCMILSSMMSSTALKNIN